MIFNKTGRTLKNKFTYDKNTLENVSNYKYLGFIVTPSGEIKTGLEDLRVRGLKALAKIRKFLDSVPQLMNDIKKVHSGAVKGDLDALAVKEFRQQVTT